VGVTESRNVCIGLRFILSPVDTGHVIVWTRPPKVGDGVKQYHAVLFQVLQELPVNQLTCINLGCAVISATSHLGDSQVGDKPTRRHESVNSATTYFLYFIIYFRVIRYRYIHFGTSVVQRYHKFWIRYTAALT